MISIILTTVRNDGKLILIHSLQILELEQTLSGSGKLSNGSNSVSGTTDEDNSPENGGKKYKQTNQLCYEVVDKYLYRIV